MKPFLTAPDLAQRWDMRVETLANWRSAGTGPSYLKLANKRILYAVGDVEAFEADSRVVLCEPVAG